MTMAVRSTRGGFAPGACFGDQDAFLRLALEFIVGRHSRLVGIVIWIGREAGARSEQGLRDLRLSHLGLIVVTLVLQPPAKSEHAREQYHGAKSDESRVEHGEAVHLPEIYEAVQDCHDVVDAEDKRI